MRCPYCQTRLQANAAECPSCRLSFPRACTLLGAVPRLAPAVADTAGVLRRADHARLHMRLAAMRRRFPQLVPQVVIHRFPAEHPFALHVFWLFNAANFAGDSRRGGANHALLVAVDPGRGEAAIVPGYGLEAVLPASALDQLLELAGAPLEQERWAEGILRLLDGLDLLMESMGRPDQGEQVPPGEF
jgi:uncharacterized membrane protein YgcG